jgi:hypothetical protein
MGLLDKLFGIKSPVVLQQERVVLLIQVKRRDGTDHDFREIVSRSRVDAICDAYAGRDDTLEVSVYEKIFDYRKPAQGCHTGDAALVGTILTETL